MKKIIIITLIITSFCNTIQPDSNYLWQYTGDGSISCCLHVGGENICNPHVACTKNTTVDLLGIYDYITRILQMEKIGTFPYAKFLNDAQLYIRKMAIMPNRISYHTQEYHPNVKFFHTMVLEHASAKNDKNKKTSQPLTDAEKQKLNQKEIFDYLVKIGLASRKKV